MNRIEIKDLSFSYGRHQILNAVNLTVSPGEIVGIVGRNGCGKSTLLSLTAGLKKPMRGSILLNEKDACKSPRYFRSEVGYVPQENMLFENLSVKDNLRLWYVKGSELKTSLEEGALAGLGIRPLLKKQVSKLSGGQKKRVSIACALAGNPSILVLDEPGAALDLEAKAQIADYLTTWKKYGGSVLITTHEEQELNICDTLMVLKEGKLTAIPAGTRGIDLVRQF